MIQTTLATLDHVGVAAAYNTVYTDYFVPFDVDARWVRQIVDRYGIALDHSPLWVTSSAETVAAAAIGIRGDAGWVGGFGVAPAYRGRGLSHDLARATIDAARAAGVRTLWLEVLSQNDRAIRTYERAGFSKVRELLVLSRTNPRAASPTSDSASDIPVCSDLLEARARIPVPRPAWQRAPAGLPVNEDLHALVIGPVDAPQAVGIYQPRETGIGLLDVVALDNQSARSLVAALVERAPSSPLPVVNEPEDSPLVPALLEAGWTQVMLQHEMAINLG